MTNAASTVIGVTKLCAGRTFAKLGVQNWIDWSGEVVAVLEYTCCRLDMEFLFVDKKFGAIRQLQFVWSTTSRDLE